MKYRRSDAKDHARAHMKGIWAAALMPYRRGPLDRREGLPAEPAPLGRRSRHRRRVRRRQAERVLLDVGCRAQALVRDRRRRDRQDRRRHRLLLRPEHGHGDRACQARPGDRRALHRRARAGAALPAQAGRDALPVLQDDQRAGRHRHRDVEPPGLRLSDEPGAVRADRRAAEHRRDQIQRAARDVCAADAAGRRQADRQHRLGGGVVRQHRRARLAALSVLVAALPVPDQGRPPDARLHRPRLRGRGREGQGRSATASIRCARRSAARGRPRSRRRIRNTGRSCSARSADGCARRCWN